MKPTPAERLEEFESGPSRTLAGPLERGIAELDRLADEMGFAALDPNVDGDGGTAFLWEDLLSLDDAAAATGGMEKYLTPEALAELLLKLVLFWRKLRMVRVALTKEEYRVMKAVKRTPGTVAEIAARLGEPEAAVGKVVDVLKAKPYRDKIMLLDEKDGILSTQF